MNRIFVLFLNYIAKGVQNEALREIMIFLCLYRKALNQYGWDALEMRINNDLAIANNNTNMAMQQQQYGEDGIEMGMPPIMMRQQEIFSFDPAKKAEEYCVANNGDDGFLICNDLVIEVLPNYFREYLNSNELVIIGPSDE